MSQVMGLCPHGRKMIPVAERSLGNSVGAIGLSLGNRCLFPLCPCGRECGMISWDRGLDGGDIVRFPCLIATRGFPIISVTGWPLTSGGHWAFAFLSPVGYDSYLVDSASSHMLVSKIKPCMSKYKQSIR